MSDLKISTTNLEVPGLNLSPNRACLGALVVVGDVVDH